MPPRIARSSLQRSQPAKRRPNARNPKKAAKRALNAFSIAQFENPETAKVSKNRLGEFDPPTHRKRARDDEDGDDEDEDESAEPKRRKRRTGSESFDEGSDSDGNTWQMGHVEDDDDEDIDSDEAFGESDEERFEGFTFRGSSKNVKGRGKKLPRRGVGDEDEDVSLDEGDGVDGEEEDDDDLGEDAIDLATALDQYEEDAAEERKEKKRRKKEPAFDDTDESLSEEDLALDGASDFSSDEAEDDEDEDDRQAHLKDLISSLTTEDESKVDSRRAEAHESAVPDEFAVARKVDILSFKPKVADEEKRKALKLLQEDKSTKRNDIARKLDAPLPKRQQDKLDRAAANVKANETLERWTDTIKQNRRAEHLMFPLQHKDTGATMGEKTLQPTTTSAPANDLESTIQAILQQSGLSNGKDDEEKLQKWEELQTNKLPIEEVMKRRAQLRMERELLFREEVRAKRIKKIKSKSYRRVHRKEREKLLQKERDQLKADGVDISEDEREYNDRRRAEERMGAKHRESKWAKGVKATGRAAWDKDALDGVTEMAKRNEELRRRIEGNTVRDEDDEGSDFSSQGDSEDDQSDKDALQRSLGKLKQNPFSTNGSKLGQMAFMQKAEAARRAQNDEVVEQMRRELASEDSHSDEENENSAKVGRKKYGPGKDVAAPAIQIKRSDFEEHPGSDDEERPNKEVTEDSEPTRTATPNESRPGRRHRLESIMDEARSTRRSGAPSPAEETGSANPYLVKAKKEKPVKKAPEPVLQANDTEESFVQAPKSILKTKSKTPPKSKSKSKKAKPQEATVDEFLQQRVTAADDDGWATVLGDQDEDVEGGENADDMEEEDGLDLSTVLRNRALTAKAFAGDNVAASFAAEKRATIAAEESSTTTTSLPGWGSWTGAGISKRVASRAAQTTTHKPGLDAEKRKDRKLDKVIINEKRVKGNVKYMASQVPFPFESRAQYERSLRVPKGGEWSTKKVFQEGTRPRVLVKQGVVGALRKPLV